MNVSLSAPAPRQVGSIPPVPRVISATRVFAPKPRPSEMPAPIASTFLVAPPTSTPTMSPDAGRRGSSRRTGCGPGPSRNLHRARPRSSRSQAGADSFANVGPDSTAAGTSGPSTCSRRRAATCRSRVEALVAQAPAGRGAAVASAAAAPRETRGSERRPATGPPARPPARNPARSRARRAAPCRAGSDGSPGRASSPPARPSRFPQDRAVAVRAMCTASAVPQEPEPSTANTGFGPALAGVTTDPPVS